MSPISNFDEFGKILSFQNYTLYGIIELGTIKLPLKIKKQRIPKGAEMTVIGLTKRRKKHDKTLPFLKKLPQEREKSMQMTIM